MKKYAQPYDSSEFAGYGQSGLAGYGQGGYDVGLENIGLIPGMDPRIPETARVQGITSPWAVPVGLAASGLIGYGLLKHLGKRLATRAAQQGGAAIRSPNVTIATLTPEQERLVQKYLPKQAHVIEALATIAR